MGTRHPCYRDQRSAVDWARRVLRHRRRYVILDLETTGLEDSDEIVQIGVIDLNGSIRINQNVRPTAHSKMPKRAVDIHGIIMELLRDCPNFRDLKRALKKAIGRKRIITYNAEFDKRLYTQTLHLAGGFRPKGAWECAMCQYAKFVGKWDSYHAGYRYQRLRGASHRSVADCFAVLRLIRSMADTTRPRHWYEFWMRR